MELEFKTTSIFTRNLEAYENPDIRFVCNQGSSRSSKSISILQLLIYICLTKDKQDITIVRQSLPVLRSTIMNDFIELMINMNLYDENAHNKTSSRYKFDNGSLIKFISTDSPAKLRGLKSTICYINEATEIDYETFMHLNIRTSDKVIFDFNPSETDFFVFDLISREPDKCIMIHSTYKDNVFLNDFQVQELEDLIKVDPEYYRVFALGLPPTNNNKIYNHFKTVSEIPDNAKLICYGQDHGYIDEAAIVEVYNIDNEFYIRELLYESYLTSGELVNRMNQLSINKHIPIYAETSRPEINTDIKKAGFKLENAIKDIKAGIDCVKSSQIFIVNSPNILNENKTYVWKTINGKLSEIPIDYKNHLLDSIRYALYTHKKKNNKGTIKFIKL